MEHLSHCTLCPRACGVNRLEKERGFCGIGDTAFVCRVGLHFWEEPCISGQTGSGTVFFAGCNLRCVFCQNAAISRSEVGKPYRIPELAQAFLSLQAQGAQNINLVTATHVIPQICEALRQAKAQGLTLPVVYNCGGYESETGLSLLRGLVDVYLPDFKYDDAQTARLYSHAPDYPIAVRRALKEMVAQTGELQFDPFGRLVRGVLVRHLILPGQTRQAKRILSYLHRAYGDTIAVSLLRQYTPMAGVPAELARPLYDSEYEAVVSHAQALGMTQVYLQEAESVGEGYIPPFEVE